MAAKKPVTEDLKITTVVVDEDLTLVVDKDVFNDWEILELMGDSEDNPMKFPPLVRKVFGENQYVRVKEHCRNEKGRVDPERMGEVFAQVMETLAKNS